MKYFTVDIQDNVATVVFDVTEEKVNVLSAQVMQELEELIHTVDTNPNIHILVFKSGKEHTFIAGADIKEIMGITNTNEAVEKSRTGQEILNKLERLSCVKIAVIQGACLGGGLELALAFDYRIVIDTPKTELGLPEVKLGIMPGFGGSYRLPQLIGLKNALKMILPGKSVKARQALKYGLVDALFPQGYEAFKVDDLIRNIKSGKVIVRKKVFKDSLLNTLFINRMICKVSKKSILEKTGVQYPAPLKALEVIQKTYRKSRKTALHKESLAFGELAVTEVSKNLVNLFFLNEKLKKYPSTSSRSTIHSAAVIGAGTMGAGIAYQLSTLKIPVRLKDINNDALYKGYTSYNTIYTGELKRKKIQAHEYELAMDRLSTTTQYSGFENKDLVIEAVLERTDIKDAVYTELENKLDTHAIIATNTSSLSVTDLAKKFTHPERFIGMHFFNPVNRMPLVEVVPHDKTSQEVIEQVVAVARKMKKVPIVVKDVKGFLVNRILMNYLFEAIEIFKEGYSITLVDSIMEQYGMPMGPFKLLDVIGIDIAHNVSMELRNETSTESQILSKVFIDNTWLGKKSNRGFYTYTGKKETVNHEIYTYVNTSGEKKPRTQDRIQERLTLSLMKEAIECLHNKVVDTSWLLDIALMYGIGYPPFKGGLLYTAHTMGTTALLELFNTVENDCGKRFSAPPLLKEMINRGESFY